MLDFMRKAFCFMFNHNWVKIGHSHMQCARCGCSGLLFPLVPAEEPLRLRR